MQLWCENVSSFKWQWLAGRRENPKLKMGKHGRTLVGQSVKWRDIHSQKENQRRLLYFPAFLLLPYLFSCLSNNMWINVCGLILSLLRPLYIYLTLVKHNGKISQ